jgi:hypothetical protein
MGWKNRERRSSAMAISRKRKPLGGDGKLVEPIRGRTLKQGRMKALLAKHGIVSNPATLQLSY